MEIGLDFSRWREKPLGVSYRRWVITWNGLRQILRSGFFRVLLFLGWITSVVIAGGVFCFSQSVASGGWLETWAANFGRRPEAVAKALGALVLLYPDICIHTLYTWLFWLQSFAGLGLSLVVLTAIIPQLITRDRASNAMTIYLSRPLTSTDYLLGKLGIIVGVLILFWTGPLLAGWIFSLLLAPNRDFVLYSLAPLGRALLFNGIGLVVLASIALGVSALTKTSRNTILLWVGLWVVTWMVASMHHTPDWIGRASFARDLAQVRQEVFQLDSALKEAVESLPLLDRNVSQTLSRVGDKMAPTDAAGAAGGLAVLVVLSSVVFFKKLRPE